MWCHRTSWEVKRGRSHTIVRGKLWDFGQQSSWNSAILGSHEVVIFVDWHFSSFFWIGSSMSQLSKLLHAKSWILTIAAQDTQIRRKLNAEQKTHEKVSHNRGTQELRKLRKGSSWEPLFNPTFMCEISGVVHYFLVSHVFTYHWMSKSKTGKKDQQTE